MAFYFHFGCFFCYMAATVLTALRHLQILTRHTLLCEHVHTQTDAHQYPNALLYPWNQIRKKKTIYIYNTMRCFRIELKLIWPKDSHRVLCLPMTMITIVNAINYTFALRDHWNDLPIRRVQNRQRNASVSLLLSRFEPIKKNKKEKIKSGIKEKKNYFGSKLTKKIWRKKQSTQRTYAK